MKTYSKPTNYNLKSIIYFLLASSFLLSSCYNQERKCKDFKTGKFKSEIEIDGKKMMTTFERNDTVQTETFNGITDTYDIRWTNDCEYILKNTNPKNIHERKAVQMKIITTLNNYYTFEYNFVGESEKQKGIVYKVDF